VNSDGLGVVHVMMFPFMREEVVFFMGADVASQPATVMVNSNDRDQFDLGHEPSALWTICCSGRGSEELEIIRLLRRIFRRGFGTHPSIGLGGCGGLGLMSM